MKITKVKLESRNVEAKGPSGTTYTIEFNERGPNESPESECSPGRADQFHDGVCSIEQRQHGRHREQEKSRGLGREVLIRFPREVISANSMKGRFAGTCASATDIVGHRCLIVIVRLGGATTHACSVRARSISMINLEYRFHANSSEFRLLVSGL